MVFVSCRGHQRKKPPAYLIRLRGFFCSGSGGLIKSVFMAARRNQKKEKAQNKPKQKKLGLVNVRFVIYKNAVKKNGTAQLYLQLRGNGQVRIPLGVFIKPDSFDAHAQKIKGRSQEAQRINLLLSNWSKRCTEIIVEYSLRGSDLSATQMESELQNEGARHSFLKWAQMENAVCEKKGILKPSTAKSERSSLARINKIHDDVSFADLTPNWFEDLEAALRKKMKLQNSTIHNTIKHLRKYVHRAIASGIRMQNPFLHYSLPNANATRIIWLNLSELKQLEQLWDSGSLSEKHLQKLRPMLFAAHTGIRYGDYRQVCAENISNDFLRVIPIKTARLGRFINIPLTARAKHYLLPDLSLGEIYSDQLLTLSLKDAARMCGINKNLSTHVMRHTFASNWVLAGRNIVALQTILGHSKLDMTLRYVHLHSTDLQEEMRLFAEWKNKD